MILNSTYTFEPTRFNEMEYNLPFQNYFNDEYANTVNITTNNKVISFTNKLADDNFNKLLIFGKDDTHISKGKYKSRSYKPYDVCYYYISNIFAENKLPKGYCLPFNKDKFNMK